MPSGAKKRKAAKKKKENSPSNLPSPSSASTHSHEGDEAGHQNDKESDVGEVSSPSSQDHHGQQNLLTEGEEETDKKEKAPDLPPLEGAKIEASNDRRIVVEETAIPVKRDFKIEVESGDKEGNFEHDDAAMKSYDGCSSGSSSNSSSDDESHGIKSSQAVVDIAPVADSVKVTDTVSEEYVEAIESTHVEVASDSNVENVTHVVLEKIPEKADVSSAADISAAPVVVESAVKENGEKKQTSVEEEQVGGSEASREAVPCEDIQSVENIVQETEDHLSLSYNAPIATADNTGNAAKDSGVNEPLLVPPPHPVQTTSWKSCCGLFEVFTWSGR